MMRVLIGIPLIIGAVYFAIMLLAWSVQGKLIYPASQERVEPAGGFEAITLETADGLSLRAFARPAEQGKPTLVYFHGNGGTLAGSIASTAMFAEYGYGLVLVNYRGYGGNPGSPSEEGFYQDGRAAMDWLAKQGVAAADTILTSNSIGSGTATQLATEYPVKALVLTAPFTSLADVASEKASWLPVRLLLKDEFDNLSKIASLDLPVLVQHGLADQLIPPHHGRALAEAAQDSTLQLYDGAGHDPAFIPKAQAGRLAWVEGLQD